MSRPTRGERYVGTLAIGIVVVIVLAWLWLFG